MELFFTLKLYLRKTEFLEIELFLALKLIVDKSYTKLNCLN